MSASVPIDRLAAADFYRQLDWLRDEWDGDEYQIAAKLVRLRKTFEYLPSRYYERSVAPLEVLAHARIVNGVDWRAAILQLGGIVSDWERQRPPLLACERCGVAVRGHPALSHHYEIVHNAYSTAGVSSG